MRIAHLCPDEKFIDIAIDIFSNITNVKSDFYVATDNTVNLVKNKNIKIVDKSFKTIQEINAQSYDYVIIHSLYFFRQKLLAKLKPEIIAITWGYDIESDYSDFIKMVIPLNLFKPYTRKAISVRPINEKIQKVLKTIDCKIRTWQKQYDKLIKKISYMSTVLPNEFDIIKEKNQHLKNFAFDYMDPKANVDFNFNTNINNNILVGNSLLPTNNHIDILNTLEQRKIKCNAYIPLAYPNGSFEQFNSEFYKNEIKKFCNNLKYVHPIFLETYMDKYEYFKIIDNCSCAIFGQLRQEATSNINHLLYTGKKIFMYKDGLDYQYYSKNAKIFTIDTELTFDIFDTYLEYEYQEQNYNFIHNKENYQKYIENLNNFFNNLPYKY